MTVPSAPPVDSQPAVVIQQPSSNEMAPTIGFVITEQPKPSEPNVINMEDVNVKINPMSTLIEQNEGDLPAVVDDEEVKEQRKRHRNRDQCCVCCYDDDILFSCVWCYMDTGDCCQGFSCDFCDDCCAAEGGSGRNSGGDCCGGDGDCCGSGGNSGDGCCGDDCCGDGCCDDGDGCGDCACDCDCSD